MTTLIPAYDRDYKSAKAVRADWEAGKDFVVADFYSKYDGKVANKEDFPAGEVRIRYGNLRQVMVI